MKNEKNDEEPIDYEAQRLYNLSQVFLMRYQILKGIIKSPQEYVERYSEIFSMLANGTLETRERIDWDSVKGKVKKIREGAVDQIKSFKIFNHNNDD